MITYELAQDLKDAGFPQRWEGDSQPVYDRYGNIVTPVDFWEEAYQRDIDPYNLLSRKKFVCIPTLSELMEVCGEGKFSLVNKGMHIQERWHAALARGPKSWESGRLYHTPEEAVARLWLSIHH